MDHRIAAILSPPASDSRRTTRACVPDDEIDVRIEIVRLPKLIPHTIDAIGVVAAGVLSIDAMHQRLSPSVGFIGEGPVAVAMPLHLLQKEGLDLANPDLHRIDQVGTVRAVVRQEVDHPNGADLANVEVGQALGSGIGVIPTRLLFNRRVVDMRYRPRREYVEEQHENDGLKK